jgi:hypothetical protein
MTSSSGTARSPVEGLTPDLGGESTEAGPSATMGAARAIDHRIVRDLKVPPRLDRGPTDRLQPGERAVDLGLAPEA